MKTKMKASEKPLKTAQFSGCKKLLIRERKKIGGINAKNDEMRLSICPSLSQLITNR